jgi:HEAT repeat protein
MPSQRGPDTPSIGGTDRLSEGPRRQAFRFRASGDSDLNDLIGQAMTRMGGVGENAERVYREAIDRLRVRGDDNARELLLRLVGNETFSLRRAAVQALVATGDEDLIRRVRELLEERGEERLLDIRPIDVRQAPQAQGGLFLVHPDTKQVVPPPDPGSAGP